ncbi:MAG TPA: glycosyltransferase family 9 protein [Thermoanaerobaculaceae bacterium]|nr:glycosyltransferase family 9 protein [Thermoanaerobaculaceae bacterium]
MRKRGVVALPARVLVDLPNWLGDLVHALPALASLRKGNRGGETWALLPAAHAAVARLLGVHVLERPSAAGFRFGRRLRGRFDSVLTARHSTRAKLLLAGTGAPLRLASRGRGAAALGLVTFPVVRARHQRHDLDAALVALAVPATSDDRFLLSLPADLAALGGRQRWLLADGSPVVAMLPATRGGNGKQYPLERYTLVARELVRAGVAVVVIVGPGEEAMAAHLADWSGARVAPTAWPLGETAALLRACDAAVGNDSGLTHLAAAVGCPTVALFGPTEPARTAPVGSAVVLRAPAPDRAGESRSLDRLPPADVVGAVETLLARAGERTTARAACRAQLTDTGSHAPSWPLR